MTATHIIKLQCMCLHAIFSLKHYNYQYRVQSSLHARHWCYQSGHDNPAACPPQESVHPHCHLLDILSCIHTGTKYLIPISQNSQVLLKSVFLESLSLQLEQDHFQDVVSFLRLTGSFGFEYGGHPVVLHTSHSLHHCRGVFRNVRKKVGFNVADKLMHNIIPGVSASYDTMLQH